VNWVYRYDDPFQRGTWTKMLSEDPNEPEAQIPLPRYAHQVVYDGTSKKTFMFGGNAGVVDRRGDEEEADGREEEKRLSDMWEMELKRFVGCLVRERIPALTGQLQDWAGRDRAQGGIPY
jgi:muskelin